MFWPMLVNILTAAPASAIIIKARITYAMLDFADSLAPASPEVTRRIPWMASIIAPMMAATV